MQTHTKPGSIGRAQFTSARFRLELSPAHIEMHMEMLKNCRHIWRNWENAYASDSWVYDKAFA
jgi:hypothetical protein